MVANEAGPYAAREGRDLRQNARANVRREVLVRCYRKPDVHRHVVADYQWCEVYLESLQMKSPEEIARHILTDHSGTDEFIGTEVQDAIAKAIRDARAEAMDSAALMASKTSDRIAQGKTCCEKSGITGGSHGAALGIAECITIQLRAAAEEARR
jgi:hypothetical protein